MTREFKWCYYGATIYQCWEKQGNRALITFPGYFSEGWVNVALNGTPATIPTMLGAPLSQLHFLAEPACEPLPPIPLTGGLQVGSRCKWNTSLAEWAVLSLTDGVAKIRQTSGSYKAVPFDAPLTELRLIGEAIEQFERRVA